MSYLKYGGQYIRTEGSFIGGIIADLPILIFYSNASTNAFDPLWAGPPGGQYLQFDLGDGSIVNANSFSHIYTVPGTKTVNVYKGSTAGKSSVNTMAMDSDNLVGAIDLSGYDNLTNLDLRLNNELTSITNPSSSAAYTNYLLQSCNITGVLDMTTLPNLGGTFRVSSNPNLTQIYFPSNSNYFSQLIASSCDITGTLDVSGLTGFTGNFNMSSNPNLTKVLNPISSQSISTYSLFNSGISGTLDLSGLSGLGGAFTVGANSGLTQIINPISSNSFTTYWSYGTNLTGVLDVSSLTGLGGNLHVGGNVNLTDILLPAQITQHFNNFDAYGCALTQTTVDAVFNKLRVYWDSTLPTSSCDIDVGTGTSSPPTDGSSNVDILAIQNIFDNSTGFSVTMTYNT